MRGMLSAPGELVCEDYSGQLLVRLVPVTEAALLQILDVASKALR